MASAKRENLQPLADLIDRYRHGHLEDAAACARAILARAPMTRSFNDLALVREFWSQRAPGELGRRECAGAKVGAHEAGRKAGSRPRRAIGPER